MIQILLVDDQLRELDGMTHMLNWAELGAEIAGAVSDAQSALEVIRSQPIDVVISDVIMQKMDGLALVHEVKACSPHTKIICISGFDDFKFVSMAINNGASGYVLKPILVNEMRQVLERVLAEIRKEQAMLPHPDRAMLALLHVGAEDWCNGLNPKDLQRPVRLAYGQHLADCQNICRLDMYSGESLVLLDDQMVPPPGSLYSAVIPLQSARDTYLQLLTQVSAVHDEQNVVATIKHNIEQHLNEELDTELLMNNVYLSAGYANALFKSATGMTIHRYVMNQRVARAAQLLLEQPDTRVKDIAWQCGFADASHLINSFQKIYDMTPEKYRRRYQKL